MDRSWSVALPPLDLRAAVSPSSINEAERTVEVTFTTGAAVKRFDWDSGAYYLERLSMAADAVRLERLNSGAPVLDAHSGSRVSSVFGVVEDGSARMTGKRGMARLRFSKNPDVDPVWANVADGILRSVSVGYVVHRYEEKPGKAGELAVRTAVDWEPYEISLVPMPADAGAQIRGALTPCVITREGEIDMATEQPATIPERNPADPGAPLPPPAAPLPIRLAEEPSDRDRGMEAERERCRLIIEACRAARIPQDVQDRFINAGTSTVDAQAEVFRMLRDRGYDGAGPARPLVTVGDPLAPAMGGIRNAILHRVAPHFFALDEHGRNYRGMNMLDIARTYLQLRGWRVTDLTKNEIAGAALGLSERGVGLHTTSDFPALLADVARGTLRRAYDEAPQTWRPLARETTLPDYRRARRLALGDAPPLLLVPEHGEYKSGTMTGSQEAMQLDKYGRKFGITREAIINDDTQAFADMPQLFGRKARALESDVVWLQITSNPVMSDGKTLFHADHNNLSANDSVLTLTSLGEALAGLAMQTDPDGGYLNLSAAFLIVPPALEMLALQFTLPGQIVIAGTVNPIAGRLTVVTDPRLTDPEAWYVAAAPAQIAWLEYAYLEGEAGPQVESRVGFDIDGVEFKCRLDFDAGVMDYRGIYKNNGAAPVLLGALTGGPQAAAMAASPAAPKVPAVPRKTEGVGA